MFYSQSFLTKKGPLGTVWCAAHLQHKLRKSHYISTNIPATVERIIDPALPMALRISGHLLLGVVRIFSKQVDYFQEDCNVVLAILNRIITTATVNLPEDANRAPLHSITLPEKFNLDSIEIDDYFKDGYEDSHTRSHEDITLTEQIPTGRDPYIAITFDENELRSLSFTENISETRDIPMEENVRSSVQPDTNAAFENPSQHNEFDANEGESSPQSIHSIEIMRAGNGFHFNSSSVLPDRVERDRVLEEQFIKEREASSTPVRDEDELPDAHFPSSDKHPEQNLSKHSNSPMFPEHPSPQLELQPTPIPTQTPAIVEPKIRLKKRKQLFDDTTVLSNKHMKKALNDTSGLLREKRNCPSSSLDIWKLNKRLKKDAVFYEPFMTGACAELQRIYNEDFVSSNLHLVKSTTDNEQDTIIPEPDLPRQDDDIEFPRNNEKSSPNMPPFSAALPSPSGRSHVTAEKSNSRVQSETNEGTEMQHDTSVGPSAGNFYSETESPNTIHREDFNIDDSALSDIPELLNSAGDLGFLEQDDYSSAGFQETAETGLGPKNQETPGLHHSLSSRTRAVAKYLKEQFPCTPISCNTEESLPGDLNLNKIMEGKSRKKCARIFYDTLVLKHNDIIEVEQEKPFDDVILKATPKLSKGDF